MDRENGTISTLCSHVTRSLKKWIQNNIELDLASSTRGQIDIHRQLVSLADHA